MLEGADKKNSYDLFWLEHDMENMAYLFEFCDKYFEELYGVEIDRMKFVVDFMKSEMREYMETGNPRMLSQSAKDSIRMYVRTYMKGDIEQYKREEDSDDLYLESYQMYWVGQMYALIHYEEDILSYDLMEILPLHEMLHNYICGHQMDEYAYLKRLEATGKFKDYTAIKVRRWEPVDIDYDSITIWTGDDDDN